MKLQKINNQNFKTIIVVYFIVFFSLFSCKDNSFQQSGGFTISATIQKGAKNYVYLEEITAKGVKLIDSIKIDKNNRIHKQIVMTEKSIYTLRKNQDEFITLLPDFKENIEIQADYNNFFKSCQIKGSKDSETLRKVIGYVDTINHKLDSLSRHWHENQEATNHIEIKTQIDLAFNKLFIEEKTYLTQLIQDNKNSLLSLLLLSTNFGREPLFPIEDNLELHLLVQESLNKSIPKNQHVEFFSTKIKHFQTTKMINESATKNSIPDEK